MGDRESEPWAGVPGASLAALERVDVNAAIVDRAGVIRHVNRAWRAFAEANGLPGPGYGVGGRYVHADWLVEPGVADLEKGLQDVLGGRADQYAAIYPCHTATERTWFRLLIVPLEAHGSAAVLHIQASPTAAVELERAAVDTLRSVVGAVMVCAWCERAIRHQAGPWEPIERARVPSAETVSHGMCPSCARELLNAVERS